MIEMTLEGGAALNKKLIGLEGKVAKKIAKKAVRDAAKVVLAPAKANAKSMVGGKMGQLISRALQLKVGKAKRRGHYFMRVQHNPKYNDEFVHQSEGSASRPTGKRGFIKASRTYIPNAIEYGHAFPGQAGGAKSVAAIPYLRSAFDGNVHNAAAVMNRELISSIERAWRVG